MSCPAIKWLLVLALSPLLACAGTGGPTGQADLAKDLQADLAEDGEPDAVAVEVAEGAEDQPTTDIPDLPDATGETWLLPPRYRCCDRITACGVAACKGYDWAGAGALFEACFGVCDDQMAESVLGSPDCDAVRTIAEAKVPEFKPGCDSNPCDIACKKLADCIVEQCEAVEPPQQPGIVSSCLNTCKPADAAWVIQAEGCAQIVQAISQADPTFNANCHGSTGVCPGPELCEPYAKKTAGCIVKHCNGNADPYAAGLEAAILNYCLKDKACPPAQAVEALNSPAVTCDSPQLKDLGPGPPFTNICKGTVGAEPAQVKLACQHLMACPGSEWVPGVDGCMVLLAMLEDAAQRVSCLAGVEDCAAVYACLEGL